MPSASYFLHVIGFLNLPKIKGSHTAIKSGLVAADAAYSLLKESPVSDLEDVKAQIPSETNRIPLIVNEACILTSSLRFLVTILLNFESRGFGMNSTLYALLFPNSFDL